MVGRSHETLGPGLEEGKREDVARKEKTNGSVDEKVKLKWTG